MQNLVYTQGNNGNLFNQLKVVFKKAKPAIVRGVGCEESFFLTKIDDMYFDINGLADIRELVKSRIRVIKILSPKSIFIDHISNKYLKNPQEDRKRHEENIAAIKKEKKMGRF